MFYAMNKNENQNKTMNKKIKEMQTSYHNSIPLCLTITLPCICTIFSSYGQLQKIPLHPINLSIRTSGYENMILKINVAGTAAACRIMLILLLTQLCDLPVEWAANRPPVEGQPGQTVVAHCVAT